MVEQAPVSEDESAAAMTPSHRWLPAAPWAWLAMGLSGLVAGSSLWTNLGSSLTTVRTIEAIWLLVVSLIALWRWGIDEDRSPNLLAGALIGLVVATIVLYGGGMPLVAVKAAVGLFWVALGILELVAWLAAPRPSLQSPWISLASLLAGIVTVTFPSVLVVEFTAVSAVWALVLGVLCLLRGVWLGMRARRPVRLNWPVWLRHTVGIGVPAVLLIGTTLGYGNLVAGTAAARGEQAELAAFYEVPSDLAPGDPGSIIRAEVVDLAGLDGTAWRVLFRSQDEHDQSTVSSGVIFVPSGDGANRPVVAWAHGTVGLGPQCAPSRDAAFIEHTDWINDALDRGWVVAGADYAGAAGTGIGEKYMVLAAQGRDVINSVRAAQVLPGSDAGDRYMTYGESQGGAVSFAAGSLGPTYAPELELVGIGGVAAASDIGAIMASRWDRPLVGWLLGPHLARSYTRHYPNLSAARILSSAGQEHYAQIADDSCVLDPLSFLINPQMGTFFGGDPTTDPDWRAALFENKAPNPPAGIPVFVGHGLDDPLIDPAFSVGLARRYCDAGATVTTEWMQGVEHIGSSNIAAPDYLAWVDGLLANTEAPSTCGEEPPVAPAPELR